MFTGIIEEIGTVTAIKKSALESRLTISAERIFSDLKTGDSVAVNGVCLTASVISGNTFTADVMNETFSRTSLATLSSGSHVNLERAMAADGRFGGHIVAGHVDGTGIIKDIRKDGNAVWFIIGASLEVLKYIVEKGSVAIDGISLTVAEVTKNNFSVSTIPHTLSQTILAEKKTGDAVNLENDIIGKYVERLMGFTKKNKTDKGRVTLELLARNGYY